MKKHQLSFYLDVWLKNSFQKKSCAETGDIPYTQLDVLVGISSKKRFVVNNCFTLSFYEQTIYQQTTTKLGWTLSGCQITKNFSA